MRVFRDLAEEMRCSASDTELHCPLASTRARGTTCRWGNQGGGGGGREWSLLQAGNDKGWGGERYIPCFV